VVFELWKWTDKQTDILIIILHRNAGIAQSFRVVLSESSPARQACLRFVKKADLKPAFYAVEQFRVT